MGRSRDGPFINIVGKGGWTIRKYCGREILGRWIIRERGGDVWCKIQSCSELFFYQHKISLAAQECSYSTGFLHDTTTNTDQTMDVDFIG